MRPNGKGQQHLHNIAPSITSHKLSISTTKQANLYDSTALIFHHNKTMTDQQQQQQIPIDETLASLTAMCHQESQGYQTQDFLQQTKYNQPLHFDIDADSRSKMVQWSFSVVDFLKFSRETVETATNILDRFMLTDSAYKARSDRCTYQLAAMTCLYSAVKIHEPEAMDPKLVSNLSRGTYSAKQVEEMELQILMAVSWRVNPPTAMAFVRHYLQLIPSTVLDPQMVEAVHDLTKFQTELAVAEYDFLSIKPSIVGFCSLMNALESVGMSHALLMQIANSISQAIRVESPEQVSQVQSWLYQSILGEPSTSSVFRKTAPAHNTNKPSLLARQSSCEVSPRSVAAA